MADRLDSFKRLLTVKQKLLDLRKLELAEAQSEFDLLHHQQEQIKVNEVHEREMAGHHKGTAFTMVAFLKQSAENILKLENQKRNVVPKIDYLQAELRKMFEETKIVENYHDKLLLTKKKKLSRAEQEQLDEIAQRSFQNQDVENN